MSSATCGVAVAVSAIVRRAPSSRDAVGEAQVVGTEVVTPLGHAVRLVDGEQRDGAAEHRLAEARRRRTARARRSRSRHAAVGDGRRASRGLAARPSDESSRKADVVPARAQRLDLVAHQGDAAARRRSSAPRSRAPGICVAERLARARRHHDQRVAAVEGRIDGQLLARPERTGTRTGRAGEARRRPRAECRGPGRRHPCRLGAGGPEPWFRPPRRRAAAPKHPPEPEPEPWPAGSPSSPKKATNAAASVSAPPTYMAAFRPWTNDSAAAACAFGPAMLPILRDWPPTTRP